MLTKIWFKLASFCRRSIDSAISRVESIWTARYWCETKHNWFFNSVFSSLSWFIWFVSSSNCFFFLNLDRLAESRLEIIRLRFLSFSSSSNLFLSNSATATKISNLPSLSTVQYLNNQDGVHHHYYRSLLEKRDEALRNIAPFCLFDHPYIYANPPN